jgi:hypothetical protein
MGFIGILLLKEERRRDGEFRRLKIKKAEQELSA